MICLLSKHWLNSRECEVEFRYAENLHKAILCARLEPVPDANITSEWQRCDLFPNHRPTTEVDIADGGEPVVLDRVGLQQLLDGLHTVGIAAEHFPWPPPDDPDRAPYRGWAPLEEADAAVFFGRDAQILRGLDVRARECAPRGWSPCSWSSARPGPGSRRFCGPGCCRGCAAMTANSCRWTSCAPNGRC